MIESLPTHPADLLRLFQPRFKHVVLVPKGFGSGSFGGIHQNHLIFRLKHFGAKEDIHYNHYCDGSNEALVLFDVYAGESNFTCNYDSSSPLTPDDQLTAAAAKALFEGPLDLTFCIEKTSGHDIAGVLAGREPQVVLSWDNDNKPVPGLIVPKRLLARSWEFFIPRYRPEYKAMEVAINLFHAQARLTAVRTASASEAELKDEVENLSDQLTHRLKEVA